jgi:hypothetical protein
VERGERQPRGIYRGLLAVLYDTTTEELGLYQPATSERVLEEMQRRAFMQHFAAAAGFAVTSVAVEPWSDCRLRYASQVVLTARSSASLSTSR